MANKPVGVRVDGLDALYKKLSESSEKVARNGMRAGLRAGGNVIRLQAQRLANKAWHVWSQKNSNGGGRSRDFAFVSQHIGMKTSISSKKESGEIAIGPVKKGFWAMFMEFGTSKMTGRPFLRPALDKTKDSAVKAFADAISDAMEVEYKK